MISPEVIDPEKNIQQEEKSILERFIKSEFAKSKEHYIFHSVRYQNHPNKIIGEVDFIFLDREVILFLEVKSNVSYDLSKNKWTSYYDRHHKVKKDPWQQVADYLFWFRDQYLGNSHKSLGLYDKFKFGYGVIFPDVQTHKESRHEKVKFDQHGKKNGYGDEFLEYDPRLIYDIDDHFNETDGIENYISRIAEYWKNHSANKYRGYGPVNNEDFDSVQKLIRTEIVTTPKLSKLIDFDLEYTRNLTIEQTGIYSAMVDGPNNHNVLLQGGPGTGKTILALEVAFSKSKKGKTLLLCYSKPLSKMLNELKRKGIINGQLDRLLDTNLEVYCMEDFIAKMGIKHENLFNGENQFKKALSKVQRKAPEYEYVVIDEAQDIFNKEYFGIIDTALKGRFNSGGHCIFMDSDFQVLHDDKFDIDYYETFIKEYNPFIFPPLVRNCRNPKSVMEFASECTGFDEMICLKDGGLSPVIRYYSTDDDLINQLIIFIESLFAQDVEFKNVSLIAPNENLLQKIISKSKYLVNIKNSSILESEKIKAGLPQDFKGLDNSIIMFITDDFKPENNIFKSSLFVSFSRAKTNLFVYFPESRQQLIKTTIKENIRRHR
jgi:predicted AAA+ superfamily ATPase